MWINFLPHCRVTIRAYNADEDGEDATVVVDTPEFPLPQAPNSPVISDITNVSAVASWTAPGT